MALFPVTSNPSWRQAAIFDNFEWPYLHNGLFDPLIFVIAQLSCLQKALPLNGTAGYCKAKKFYLGWFSHILAKFEGDSVQN